MIDMVKNIRLAVEVAQFVKLDEKWRTSRFESRRAMIPYCRLYFPVEGEGYVLFNNRELHLRPGFMYLIPPFVATEVYCPKRLVKYWTHFNAYLLDSELDIFNLGNADNEIPVENHGKVVELFQMLVRSYRTPPSHRKITVPPIRELECNAALTLLLVPFYESLISAAAHNPGVNERFLKILHYVEAHLSGSLSLKELAREVHLNPTYLSNMFAEKMGIPLIQYCNNRRIARAINLLRNTDYSLEEIAAQQGAESTAAFSRLFKRRTGMSPRAYRKMIENEHLQY